MRAKFSAALLRSAVMTERPDINGAERIKRAKRYGKAQGWAGNRGGWVFDKSGRTLAQGWDAVYLRYWRRIELERELEKHEATADAVAFFREHAGYSVGPNETEAQGKARSARALATAEARGRAAGLTFLWQRDGLTNREWTDEGPEYETWQCDCIGPDNMGRASLCGIDFGEDGSPHGNPYGRVVEAELAAQALEPIAARRASVKTLTVSVAPIRGARTGISILYLYRGRRLANHVGVYFGPYSRAAAHEYGRRNGFTRVRFEERRELNETPRVTIERIAR